MAYPGDPPGPVAKGESSFGGGRLTSDEFEQLASAFRPSWEFDEAPFTGGGNLSAAELQALQSRGGTSADIRAAVQAVASPMATAITNGSYPSEAPVAATGLQANALSTYPPAAAPAAGSLPPKTSMPSEPMPSIIVAPTPASLAPVHPVASPVPSGAPAAFVAPVASIPPSPAPSVRAPPSVDDTRTPFGPPIVAAAPVVDRMAETRIVQRPVSAESTASLEIKLKRSRRPLWIGLAAGGVLLVAAGVWASSGSDDATHASPSATTAKTVAAPTAAPIPPPPETTAPPVAPAAPILKSQPELTMRPATPTPAPAPQPAVVAPVRPVTPAPRPYVPPPAPRPAPRPAAKGNGANGGNGNGGGGGSTIVHDVPF